MATEGNPSWLEPHLGTCEAIVALFHPFAEVAVHDIRRDRIVALWNPISQRQVGDGSLLGELPDYPDDARVIGPYPKVLADGRAITSVSVVLYNAKGARRGLLCIDFDRSPFDGTIELLSRFAAPAQERPLELQTATGASRSICSSTRSAAPGSCGETGSPASSVSRSSGSSTSAASLRHATPRRTRRAPWARPAPPSTPC